MKATLLFLALCAGLALAVAGGSQRSPAIRKPQRIKAPRGSLTNDPPSDKDKNIEDIKNLLTPFCNSETECEVLVSITAMICGVPSEMEICQTDCQFLLQYLWDETFAENRPEIDELKKYVPDACAPALPGKNSLKQSAPSDEEDEDENGLCLKKAPGTHEADNHNMLHLGFEFDDDEDLQDVIAEFKSVENDLSNVTCFDPDLPSVVNLRPGHLTKKPCGEKFPLQVGDIWGVCLESGVLYYSNEKCDVDIEKWENAVDAYAKDMRAMTAVGDIDAKKAFEGGATLIKGVADFLAKDKVKDFISIAGKISTVLGPVGIAFQVVAFFLPAHDPKHDAIMAEFKKLEQSNMELKNAIERLPDIFKKELFDARIEEMVSNLNYLESDIDLFASQNTDAFRNKVEKSCANFPGDKFISDINSILTAKSPDYISRLFGYGIDETESYFKPLLASLIRAASAASKCLGLDKSTTESDLDHFTKTLEERIKLTHSKVLYIVEDWIPNNAMAQYIEYDLKDWMEKHKGEDNRKLSDNLYEFMRTKYHFYSYGIAIYDKTTSTKTAARSTDCFRCVGKDKSGMFYWDQQYDKSVMIMYSNTYIPDVEDYVKKVWDYAGRDDLQYFVDYLKRGSIKNSMACRFGQGLRATMSSYARFYNIGSVSTMVTY